MKKIRIGSKLIGAGEPVLIIAEAGVNHNGQIKLAKKLVEVASQSGADAVKFQTFSADRLVTLDAQKATYQKESKTINETQYKMLKKLELSKADHKILMKYAEEKGITLLSTPFDEESADLLEQLGVNAFKIGSGDLTTLPLLKYIAEKKLPMILSTGMATLCEVEDAVRTIRSVGNEELVLLHCTSSYPARIEDCNLKTMQTLAHAFQVPVGYSDHTIGITVPIAAVALGAKIIEKHFTLNRMLSGPDHKASIEASELGEMVTNIRMVEKALGSALKKPTEAEMEIRKVSRKSIVAKVDIPSGTEISKEMISLKRPGIGLPPKFIDIVIGRAARVNIKKDQLITWEKI